MRLRKTHKYSKYIDINLMAVYTLVKYRRILIMNYTDIKSKYVGETFKNICKVFEISKEMNSILFF